MAQTASPEEARTPYLYLPQAANLCSGYVGEFLSDGSKTCTVLHYKTEEVFIPPFEAMHKGQRTDLL